MVTKYVSKLPLFQRMLRNGPEYDARRENGFRPPMITMAELHAGIPKHLFEKSTPLALYFVIRDIFFISIFYLCAVRIDSIARYAAQAVCSSYNVHVITLVVGVMKGAFWVQYWFWQSLAFTGCWCLAHDFGHGSLTRHRWANDVSGFLLHTCLLVPYYSWRSTHHAHHKGTGSMERDENYVPSTRSYIHSNTDFQPHRSKSKRHFVDCHDIFEETPLYTVLRLLFMQLFGWHIYLMRNTMGNPRYPKGTNHFSPSSPLFKPEERSRIIISNLALLCVLTFFSYYSYTVGLSSLFKLYIVPYLLCHHWIVMLTFLHHTDPTLPHYRGSQWSFARGALATVDRPLLGWIGRFFFHNIAHDHVAHHLFSSIPFYNLPEATIYLKSKLREDYNFDSTNTFYALYRSFTECCFVEDEGDIVFYKNMCGKAQREVVSELH